MKQECQKCEPEKWTHKENGQTIMLCDEHWNALGMLSTINDTVHHAPHTHGEHGSHARVEFTARYGGFIQFICLDDGVIYKELEITREVK